MKNYFSALCALLIGFALPVCAQSQGTIPHLEKRGAATQLIVDGKPFLILGGELRGTASSGLGFMDTVWPKMSRLNLNTVLLALGWDWIEPKEGTFDFTLVDGLIAGARKHDKHIVFLWFGSWKNGMSSFAPPWVKADQERFPRVSVQDGQTVEILSQFSRNNLEADTRAYVKLLQHIKQVDSAHTVLMMQMQNEVGINSDTRDRSEAANQAFAGAVPEELMSYLVKNKDHLSTHLTKVWTAAGAKSSGTWAQVFGEGPAGEDIFSAWAFARYMDQIAAAGKAVYPLPVYTNTALGRVNALPGQYGGGSPQFFTLDIWKAGAPSIDLIGPDVYAPNFDEYARNFHRPDNPLFIPESQAEAGGVANAFFAFGAHSAIGYSPFGLDDTAWLLMRSPEKGAPGTDDLEKMPLALGYAVLRNLTPVILEHQAQGSIDAAWLNKDQPSRDIEMGDYILHVELRRATRSQIFLSELGYALVMGLAPDEFVVAGSDVQVTFTPRTAGPPIAGLADAEIGHYEGTRWVAERKRNGDDVLLSYKLADLARIHQSGSGLRFLPGEPTIQRVKLYRYH
jgi:Domain of unknown function (DUF5597)/Beta-galactosidase